MAQYTQAHLDALNEAIASGAKEVWYGHKKVEYRSLADMLATKREIIADLAGTPRQRRRVARFHSGN